MSLEPKLGHMPIPGLVESKDINQSHPAVESTSQEECSCEDEEEGIWISSISSERRGEKLPGRQGTFMSSVSPSPTDQSGH